MYGCVCSGDGGGGAGVGKGEDVGGGGGGYWGGGRGGGEWMARGCKPVCEYERSRGVSWESWRRVREWLRESELE